MAAVRRRKLVRGAIGTVLACGARLMSCTALIEAPGAYVDVQGDNVFVNFLGATVRVTDDHVVVDVPSFHIHAEAHDHD